MPYNYIKPSLNLGNPIIRVKLNTENREKQQTKFSEWNKRLEEIVKFVEQRETGFFEASVGLILNVIDRLGLSDTRGRYIWMSFAGYNGETLAVLIKIGALWIMASMLMRPVLIVRPV